METPFRIQSRPWSSDAGVARGLIGFEFVLYAAVGVLLAGAACFILVGTVTGLVGAAVHDHDRVDAGVVVLDRILLTLIIAELVYTLRLVVQTHEIAVEPFLYIGLIAVVRRILIVTAQLERGSTAGRAATNLLLELGVLGLLVPALAVAVVLVRRGRRPEPALG